MNNYRDVIITPVITEKTASLAEENKVVFKVDLKANKTQIKQAVEKIFDVKVVSVHTLISHPKKRRVGKYTGSTKRYKKAIVKLAEGSTISFD